VESKPSHWNVISDIVGETGLTILEAIIAGQRDPKQLATLCSSRIKASRETVAKSLHGNWDEALLSARTAWNASVDLRRRVDARVAARRRANSFRIITLTAKRPR
jgi:hypothetical protein